MKIGDDGNLYAWGNNSRGQLGIGNLINQSKPQKVNLPNGEKPVSIELGSDFSMCITDKGNLYSWGDNYCGKMGTTYYPYSGIPELVSFPNNEKPVSITVGREFSMCITDKGNLYGWGKNFYKQLGINGSSSFSRPQLITLPNGEKPITIALGGAHTMVITDKGNLYACGNNDYGKLGLGHKLETSKFELVTLPNEEKAKSISLGFDFSMVLTNEGNLYSWGFNSHGELGIGHTNNQLNKQKVILPNEEKPVSISSGMNHTLVVTDKGNVFAWGMNDYGQLGMGASYYSKPQLVKIPNNEKVLYIHVGQKHSLCITDKGNLYTWGYNQYGQLGMNDFLDKKTPTKVDLP